MFDEKQGRNISELNRKIANIIRVGTISEVDYEKARARVKIGDITTRFLPWIVSRAGTNRTWKPVDVGEQVMILSPNGDLNYGVILHSLYQTLHPAPSQSKDTHTVVFEDGSYIEYDKGANHFKADLRGTAEINIAKDVSITAQTASITAESTTINGNCYLAGNGGQAVARVGDSIEVYVGGGSSAGTHPGKIVSGSSKVSSG
ncbi:MAG: phage baseplate assembly protein V [Alphaproteobacteria bacterium]|jgi:phage baseplate assembly protein V|nr:phage baseplate assembly protein V [Alphaproteobacteria bacterium]